MGPDLFRTAILRAPAAGVCGTFLVIVLLSLPGSSISASDEQGVLLLQAARAAVGGEAALTAVGSLTASGKLNAPGGQSGDIVVDLAPPDRFRTAQRLMFPMVGSAEVVHVLKGEAAWTDTKTKAACCAPAIG